MVSSSWNQNNKDSENISNIKLGKCENILKEIYNISLDIPLLIFKLDIDIEGYSAPLVEYEIYNPITKEKLNLKYCQDEQIDISIPVSIDENELFKYNLNSEFYNDICSTYTTNFKTDISLKDRQNEFLNKNMTLCESDCNYASFNTTLKKVNCECDVKNKIKDLSDIKIDKNKLKASLNLKNLINTQVLKCYRKVFTKQGLFHNIGSYILLSIISLYIISLIYLIFKDYSILKNEIKDLFYFSWNINNMQTRETSTNTIKKFETKEDKNKKRKSMLDTLVKSNKVILEKDDSNNLPILNQYLKINKKEKRNSDIQLKKNKINKNIPIELQTIYGEKINSKKILLKLDITEFELNNFSYKRALLYDNRTFCQYFIPLIKTEHILLFAIIPSKDYNSKAIKICIFLFTFALFFAENALFINEGSIHNIYENQGTLDLIYQLPQIIYSNIISLVLDKIIRFFSLSQADVIHVKHILRRKKSNKGINKFFRILFVKYIIFFFISFVFLFFFWLYISCFCFVYRNTQSYLIKDTLFSFGLSLVSPFIVYLISAALRIYSLRDKRKKRNIIYIIYLFN